MKSSYMMDALLNSERGTGMPVVPSRAQMMGYREECEALQMRKPESILGDYPEGWGPVPDEPKASTETGSKWNVHPQSTIADVPAIAKHIRSWHCAACPGVVEVPVDLFFAIGTAIESMKTAEAVCVPVKDEPKMVAASLIRYEWRAFPYSGTDMINAEFSKGWEFCGSIGGNCILRRVKP